jgi:hypothetical protein
MSWLLHPSIVDDFRELFLGFYSHMKGFHGCRPISVRSYYERGMLGQDDSGVLEAFRRIFSDVDARYLDAAIAEMGARGDNERGRIYFLCDDVELVKFCGHYLIQGSEYLIALAACLGAQRFSDEDFRMRLRTSGIPTIFEADIPLSYVPPAQIDGLMRSVARSSPNGARR